MKVLSEHWCFSSFALHVLIKKKKKSCTTLKSSGPLLMWINIIAQSKIIIVVKRDSLTLREVVKELMSKRRCCSLKNLAACTKQSVC